MTRYRNNPSKIRLLVDKVSSGYWKYDNFIKSYKYKHSSLPSLVYIGQLPYFCLLTYAPCKIINLMYDWGLFGLCIGEMYISAWKERKSK